MSANQYAKLWVQDNLNQLAMNRALEAIESGNGWSLPCSVIAVNGSIVQVQFEVQQSGTTTPWPIPPIWIPKSQSPWCRIPTQNGDIGLTVSADTYLGGITGMGSGVADLSVESYGNLGATLVFWPLGSVNDPASPDVNSFWGNGPNGGIIGSADGSVQVYCNKTAGTVTIKAGGQTWTFGAGGLTMSSGIVAETHLHAVTAAPGTTGVPEA